MKKITLPTWAVAALFFAGIIALTAILSHAGAFDHSAYLFGN